MQGYKKNKIQKQNKKKSILKVIDKQSSGYTYIDSN